MNRFHTWIIITILGLNVSMDVNAYSDGHPSSKITGDQIELFENRHSFAGSILNKPVFGVFDESAFESKVQIRKDNQTLTFEIKESAQSYTGNIEEDFLSPEGSHSRKITKVEFVGLKKSGEMEGHINLKIDNQLISVKVIGEAFQAYHFHAPQFEAQIGSKLVSFKFAGEACFGYSTNLAMMIFGTYYHLLK
jgi:hypothetical protein